jgi:hypothetical protein
LKQAIKRYEEEIQFFRVDKNWNSLIAMSYPGEMLVQAAP